jgi:hypothetical protein
MYQCFDRVGYGCPLFDATGSGARPRMRSNCTREGAPTKNQAEMTASQMLHPKDDISMNGQMGFAKKW